MNRVLYIIAIAFTVSFTSCIDANDIQVLKFESVTPKGIGSQNMAAEITLSMQNDGRAVKLKDAEITAYLDSKQIARVWVDDKVKLKHGTHSLMFPLRIKLLTKGGLLEMLAIYNRVDELRFDVTIKGGVLFVNKKIEYNKLSLDQLERVVDCDLRSFIK